MGVRPTFLSRAHLCGQPDRTRWTIGHYTGVDARSGLTRANRLVTFFEPVEDGAGGVGEVGVEREALAVDVDGR